LFVRREAFARVGGAPDQTSRVEIDLCRRLRRIGRLALAGAAVVTSARRFREVGVLRTYGQIWRDSRGNRRGISPGG
jgi:O-acetyl-ADP-ribose deacetylase (regulator of RNase III)